MNSRFKIGFIQVLNYGPSADQQEQMLVGAGVLKDNIFRSKPDTILDAINACRLGDKNILVVAFERILGKLTGEVFKQLDERGADLYCVASDTLYPGANGATFCEFLKQKQKGQTAKARSMRGDRKGGAPVKVTATDLLRAEKLIHQGWSMREVTDELGVAPNYLYRKGITLESVTAKYDN